MGLDRYRKMRNFTRTPEPSGKQRRRRGWSFVVQKHAASHLHYDFRLELDGVLKSWSVPKGPSYDTRAKHLAVQTEDHPVEYGGFEGIIPEGEYGGGTVMLWDRGTWTPVGDPHVGLERGKLEIELHGERLKGRWQLVRLKERPQDRGKATWLLFKRTDEHADPAEEITVTTATSVATGRTMDEIAGATGKKRKVWRSNRAGASEGATTMKARIRAAAREGRAKREKVATKNDTTTEVATTKKRAAKKTATKKTATKKTATKKTATKKTATKTTATKTTATKTESTRKTEAARRWSVAPREAAYRGPTHRKRAPTITARRELVGTVSISNPDRVIDIGSGVTKLDLARYYEVIADPFLEHAGDRPLALVRCPEGSAGECFYQKHSHPGMSKTIHTAVDRFGEELLSVTTRDGAISLAQWGAVEVHGWGSRGATLETPDWIVLDLDPAEDVAWGDVVHAALELRERLTEIGLESFVKTTGGKGLHVVVPLTRRHDWDVVKDFSHALALDAVHRDPSRYVAVMSKSARRGKIFVDYLRNVRGATAVLPYSARARDGLPVAMPIEWSQLREIDPGDFTVQTVPGLLATRKNDPWKPMRATRQSITRGVLEALSRR